MVEHWPIGPESMLYLNMTTRCQCSTCNEHATGIKPVIVQIEFIVQFPLRNPPHNDQCQFFPRVSPIPNLAQDKPMCVFMSMSMYLCLFDWFVCLCVCVCECIYVYLIV